MDPFDGIKPGMRWEDEGTVWEVVTYGTVQHKSTEYDVVYYLAEGTCYLEDELTDVAEWSKAEEVAHWLAIMKPIDSRFPKSLTDRSFGLRTHPLARELPSSPFWKRPDVAADLPAAIEAMQWLGTMSETEAGAMKVMMSGAVVALSELADEMHIKLPFGLLRKPSSDDKAFLPYVAVTKDIKIQHETWPVLRALFFAAGLRNAENTKGSSKWILVVPEALERLLGVSAMKTGVNGLKKAACYTDLEMIKFKKRKPSSGVPIDPMTVTEPALRRLIQSGTLGDVAKGENGSVLPTWLVRHRLVSAMIDHDDPRVRAHVKVCVDKPKSVFVISVKARKLKGIRGDATRFAGGFVMTARFSFQAWARSSMGAPLHPQVAALNV